MIKEKIAFVKNNKGTFAIIIGSNVNFAFRFTQKQSQWYMQEIITEFTIAVKVAGGCLKTGEKTRMRKQKLLKKKERRPQDKWVLI